jgi:TRAP-type C4-dicarboxylate transport system permease small subunit
VKRLGAWIGGALLLTGSVGLLGAMLTDALAVAGRHSGVPVLGSIEIVQAFVAIGAASAIAYASMSATHAAVDLVFHRLPPWAQDAAHRMAAVLGFVFVAALVTGSAWIVWEYRDAQEMTEILRIPIQYLRLFWLACSVIAAIAMLGPLFEKRKPAEADGGPH